MKKRKHLETNFINFIIEKYQKNEKLPKEESNVSDEEIIDDIENPDDIQDNEDDEDDETIDDLIKEFTELNKKYRTLKK
jgi:hypothetical protein